MPGTDPRAATAAIFAELPDFPYLAAPHEGFSGGHGMATDK